MNEAYIQVTSLGLFHSRRRVSVYTRWAPAASTFDQYYTHTTAPNVTDKLNKLHNAQLFFQSFYEDRHRIKRVTFSNILLQHLDGRIPLKTHPPHKHITRAYRKTIGKTHRRPASSVSENNITKYINKTNQCRKFSDNVYLVRS